MHAGHGRQVVTYLLRCGRTDECVSEQCATLCVCVCVCCIDSKYVIVDVTCHSVCSPPSMASLTMMLQRSLALLMTSQLCTTLSHNGAPGRQAAMTTHIFLTERISRWTFYKSYRQARMHNRVRQLYNNISLSMLFLFPVVKGGKLSTGVNATFNASCYG